MAEVDAVLLSPSSDKLTETREAIAEYDFIRFTFADMNGVLRGALLPAEAASKYLSSGIGCMSGVTAFGTNNTVLPKEVRDSHFANMQVIPDLSTLHPVPWIDKYRVGQFISETFWNPTTPQEACTRNMARRMLRQLDDMGLKLYSGTELEFVLVNPDSQLPVSKGNKMWCLLHQLPYETWFYDVVAHTKKAGVSIKMMHAEFAPGQFEFTTEPSFGIKSIDSVLILKQGIKEMALQRGLQANFMAYAYPGDGGSHSHFNFSVWHKDSEKNAFLDEVSSDNEMSEFGKHWMAGMIYHARALTALSYITTNCYQPLDFWVPHYANWGIGDRTATFRIKTDSPSGPYIENRLPTGPSNSYLVTAATIAAGIDGIVHNLPCPPAYQVSEAPKLPCSLKEALDCLREDTVMVEALGKTFVEWFIQSKTEADLKMLEGVTDKDVQLDLEREQYAYLM